MPALLAALSALFLPAALATQVGVGEVPCPLGDESVKVYHRISANSHGGWDADLASYSTRGQFREHAVSTCPTSLYSVYGEDMSRPLSEAEEAAVRAALAEVIPTLSSRTDPPVWERYRLAGAVYEALGKDPFFLGDLYLRAAWTARDHAVGVYQGLEGPAAVRALLDQGEVELAKELSATDRRNLLYNLARVAHRGGYGQQRDRYLAQLEEVPGLRPADIEAIARMRRVARELEPRYQDLAIEKLSEGLRQEGVPLPQKIRNTYLLAETLRRRGRIEDAAPLFALVLAEPSAPDELRELSLFLSRELMAELAP